MIIKDILLTLFTSRVVTYTCIEWIHIRFCWLSIEYTNSCCTINAHSKNTHGTHTAESRVHSGPLQIHRGWGNLTNHRSRPFHLFYKMVTRSGRSTVETSAKSYFYNTLNMSILSKKMQLRILFTKPNQDPHILVLERKVWFEYFKGIFVLFWILFSHMHIDNVTILKSSGWTKLILYTLNFKDLK